MMTQIKIKSHAKLNLALNVTGKNSSLHKIESIVAFASLHDEIFISKIKSNSNLNIKATEFIVTNCPIIPIHLKLTYVILFM